MARVRPRQRLVQDDVPGDRTNHHREQVHADGYGDPFPGDLVEDPGEDVEVRRPPHEHPCDDCERRREERQPPSPGVQQPAPHRAATFCATLTPVSDS